MTRRFVWPLAAIGAALMVGCIPPTGENPPAGKPVITTVAGSGVAGLSADGEPVLESPLYLPQDITLGPDGRLYVVDWNNHRIRRINSDNTFETIVGTGELGDAGDGYAKDQQLNHPTNIAFDADGRMIIAAWHNSKIKRIDLTTGEMVNIAGTGGRNFGGDGGQANAAILDLPSSVQVDTNGNILVSDQANYRIRLIEPNGTITTICGDGTPGYSGDGGRAETAQLNSPKGQSAQPAGRIALDAADQIYIADTANHVIRMVAADGRITTLAGTGTAGYSGDGGPATMAQLNTPSDVEIMADGSILIADTFNNRIRKVSPDGIITTIAGTGDLGYGGDGGPADEAVLDRPYGVESAANGDVYIADTHNNRIRRITAVLPPDFNPNTPVGFPEVDVVPCTNEVGSICTWAGTGQTGFSGDGADRLRTVLYWPFDVAFQSSGTYVIDWNNHRIRRVNADDTFQTVVGTDDLGDGPFDLSDLMPAGALGTTVNLNHPTDLFELPDGTLGFIAWHNHKIRTYDPETNRVVVVAGRGAGFIPMGMMAGDNIAVKSALFNQPAHAVLDAAGNLFLVDQRNQRIRVIRDFTTLLGDGTIYTVAGTGTKGYNGDGVALQSQISYPAGGNPEPTGGIAIDRNGVIYFSDTHNHLIRRLEFADSEFLDGTITTIAGLAPVDGTARPGYGGDGGPAVDAQINFPQDIEIGPDGNVYFADTNNNRIRMINLETGVITTVVGNGTEGYSGDGGMAVNAMLNRPFGIEFDAAGDLYVSDTFNSRVRKVTTGLGSQE